MKNKMKYAWMIIIPPALVVVMISVLLASAFAIYNDSGNVLYVITPDSEAVENKLNRINLPYGSEVVEYDNEACLRIESRTELMPIIEEFLCESDIVPVYRDIHERLFYTFIFSFSLTAVLCVVYGKILKNRFIKWSLLSMAVLCVIGCPICLNLLPLTL